MTQNYSFRTRDESMQMIGDPMFPILNIAREDTPTDVASFVYKVDGISPEQKQVINASELSNAPEGLIAMIKQFGGSVAFKDVVSSEFKRNLLFIDGLMPELLADVVLLCSENGLVDMDSAVRHLTEKDLLEVGDTAVYSSKIKNFLTSCALGLKHGIDCNCVSKSEAGYLITSDNKNLRAYHIHDKELFERKVLKAARFYVNPVARIYEEQGEILVNIGLRISFVHQ